MRRGSVRRLRRSRRGRIFWSRGSSSWRIRLIPSYRTAWDYSRYRLRTRDAPDIRPNNPAFFDIRYRYPAGYQISLPDIRLLFS
jgi:hypothetical protein